MSEEETKKVKPSQLLSNSGKCPIKRYNKQESTGVTNEPPDTPDRPLPQSHMDAKVTTTNSDDPFELVPSGIIPASGRGNSEDGTSWRNPSAGQLFRALQRRGKPIEEEDSLAVAVVHQMVTDNSWNAVMEYENMHERECDNITLARFEGKDGIYSPKARFMKFFYGLVPFDRHDWVVDRCGKEVTYVIDYYSVDDGADDVEYFVDARPAGLSGMFDRVKLAFNKWKNDEKWF
eukprot:m.134852 g.134852  ORF g.134852 m.134852 type:complete len:233 (+) comp9757_c0_seq1:79-777(+)